MKQSPNRAGEMAAFVRVVERGSFADAGRALGLSPSAVSKVMTRLETRLGAILLRRSTRRIALTPEGELYYRRATAILAELDAAEREAAGASTPSGRVRINSSASYVTHILSHILSDFLAQYTEVNVDIVQTDEISDLLRDGSDIAIRAGELPSSSLIARSLGRTRVIVAAAPSWLERQGSPVKSEQLISGDRVGFAYPRAAGEWLPRQSSHPARVRVSDGEGIRQLALAGVGPARLAEFTVRDDIAAGRLVPILVDELPILYEPFHAVFAGKPDHLPARLRVLLNYLCERGSVN